MTSSKKVSAGELTLLSRIRSQAAGLRSPELRHGIGDDCAILRPRRGEEIVITTDLSLEGRHFRSDWHSPEVIGHRTLARGLSDLAAMGARPVAAFLSLGIPAQLTKGRRGKSWLDRFYSGFFSLAQMHKVPLAGGDLAQSPIIAADIVLLGAVPQGRALLRSTARPGDILYVTGTLGGAAAGLRHLAQHNGKVPTRLKATLAAHLEPQPRIAQGRWLARHGGVAALDISDGLSTDLAHLCEESRVAAEIDADSLPIAPGATLEEALHGGEDYELLFAARPAVRIPRTIAGVPITQIGRVSCLTGGRSGSARPQITIRTTGGTTSLIPRGWQHFQ